MAGAWVPRGTDWSSHMREGIGGGEEISMYCDYEGKALTFLIRKKT